jgi:hypothetical protein
LAQTIRRRRSFKESRRLWFREQLIELGIASPDGLAKQLQLLVDGSTAGNLVRDDPTMACAAKQAAKVLLRMRGLQLTNQRDCSRAGGGGVTGQPNSMREHNK